MERTAGIYLSTTTAGEPVKAFVPKPLPPEPPLNLSPEIELLYSKAEQGIAALKVASEMVPNLDLFAYAFVRKEAIFSSQIEGIQATLSDLFAYETNASEMEDERDILEVCNYLDALQFGRKQLSEVKGLPLSLRLIREMHLRLLRKVRGNSKKPGEFRSSQNWIGGSRPGNAHFVPPPPEEMMKCLAELEKYFHKANDNIPPLIKIGLIHVQFETIHPFLDGNGRVGRLLIALLLELWCGLDARFIYLSLFFKRNRTKYYESLDAVRKTGDWEAWSKYFLEGLSQISGESLASAQKLFRLFERDRKKLLDNSKASLPALRLFEVLPSHPVLTSSFVVKILKTTKPTAGKTIDFLLKQGILSETTGGKRNRIFTYRSYLKVLTGDENER
jgi:Fic family protein